MKALRASQPRTFLQIQVPDPHLEPGVAGQIVVRNEWVSLCGSDVPIFTGSKRNKTFPLAAGAPNHECVGRVVESSSEKYPAGSRVIAVPLSDLGLAELFLTTETRCALLPDDLPDPGPWCLIQPLATVLNAVDRLGDVSGRSVAVIGLGSIGLLFCWLLKLRGAARIAGIDPIAERCAAAHRFGAGATLAMRSIEAVHQARLDPRTWEPPDICIEAAGHQTETINDALELVRKQGTVLAFGVPDQPVYPFEYETFFRKNAHLLAVVTPEWSEYLPRARDLFFAHREELADLVTHRLPISQAARAFSLYERRDDRILKVLLDATQWE